MNKTLLAERFRLRLLGIITVLSPFYVTLDGCELLDSEEVTVSALLDNAE